MLTKNNRRIRVMAGIAALSILAACGGGGSSTDPSASSDSSVTTSTISDVPVYPLLGTPITDQAAATRMALVVKIDNHPATRPQTGLNKADIVFEENVEGLTRFAAVFHSQGSDPVGPIRSGRTQDIDFLSSFNKPLFAWSGGNARVTKAVNASDLVNIGHSASRGKGGYYRSTNSKAPYNLYSKTTDLWTLAPTGATAPQPQFIYRGVSDAKASTLISGDGAKLSMYGVKILWKWDAASGSYLRFTEKKLGYKKYVNEPHMSDKTQINPANVVVLYITYVKSKADRKSPHALTTGKGTGFVLTDGGSIPVTWLRGNRKVPFTLLDANGAVVRLTPGRTWVELGWKNSMVSIATGVNPDTIAWPNP